MFSKLYNMVRQHKKKVMFTVGLAGGAYLLNRYVQRKLHEWESRTTQSYLDQIKHQHHFESILQTSDSTVLSLLPKIREPLLAILETDSLLERLKTRPPNRLELWEEMKVRILTFAVCSVYAESLLAALLRVQLGVVGGYVYVNSQRSQQTSGGVLPALTNQDIHQRYLSLIQHFFDAGIEELTHLIKAAVVSAFGHVSLKEHVSTNDFVVAFDYIKSYVSRDQRPLPNFLRLLFPPLRVENDSQEVSILNTMTLETRDILETEDFSKVLAMCIDVGFANLRTEIEECFRIMEIAEGSGDHVVSCFPLARLLPVLKSSLVAERNETFLKRILQAELLRSMLANVYEAFCQTEDIDRINHNLAPFS